MENTTQAKITDSQKDSLEFISIFYIDLMGMCLIASGFLLGWIVSQSENLLQPLELFFLFIVLIIFTGGLIYRKKALIKIHKIRKSQ